MENTFEITLALNERLQEKLERAGCRQGHFVVETTTTFLITLSGKRENDNKTVLLWDFEPPFQKALQKYMDVCAPEAVAFCVDIDLAANTFHYSHTSQQQREANRQKDLEKAEQEKIQQQQHLKQHLAAQKTPYGTELAEKVAEALKQGSIGNGHRDYCGMGLEIREDVYCYGEIWDGGMMTPLETFKNSKDFITWLSKQSDASMSRINEKDPWYWNNQVINRKRLETFVQFGWS